MSINPGHRGPKADLKLCEEAPPPESLADKPVLGDKAYQSSAHPELTTPHKKPKGGELTEAQIASNKQHAAQRVYVEHGIRRVKADLRSAYSQQWFLGVQRQLWGDFYLSANYVGTSGKKLYIRNDINRFSGDRPSLAEGPDRFNQEWAETFYVQNGNDSIYHGTNIQFQKRYSSRYMFTFNYTLGKSIDIVSDPGLGDFVNVSVGGYNGTQDAGNARLDRAPSDFDVRHRISLHGIWDIPSPNRARKNITSRFAHQAHPPSAG